MKKARGGQYYPSMQATAQRARSPSPAQSGRPIRTAPVSLGGTAKRRSAKGKPRRGLPQPPCGRATNLPASAARWRVSASPACRTGHAGPGSRPTPASGIGRLRALRRGLLCTLLAFSSILPLFAQERHALVIGNAAYRGMTPLKNPVNDAADIAAALKDLGFVVDLVRDASLSDMESAVVSLGDRLKRAPGSKQVPAVYNQFFDTAYLAGAPVPVQPVVETRIERVVVAANANEVPGGPCTAVRVSRMATLPPGGPVRYPARS